MPIQIPGIAPGITIGQLRRTLEDVLAPHHGVGEARAMVAAILEAGLEMGRTALLARAGQPTDPIPLLTVTSMADRVLRGEPLQYVLGFVDWGGLRLHVGYGVLIPRPETEWILGRILAETAAVPQPALLDLCTGSGCIPLGYKHARPDAHVTGVDVSEAALRWAEINQHHNDLEAEFFLADILQEPVAERLARQAGKWNIITSNPPYVPDSERAGMASHVLDHEPEQALFVPDHDPLVFYRRITALAIEWLAPGGCLFFECHTDYAGQVAAETEARGFDRVKIEDDPYERPRLVWAYKS